MRLLPTFVGAALGLAGMAAAQADFFGTGDGSFAFEIEFVPIGAPGNPPDLTPTPKGAVAYPYRMAKYEVSQQMVFAANALGNLGITYDDRGFDKPATGISWYEAARFANWLNTSTGYPPAYKFDANGAFQLWTPDDPGFNPANPFRNRRSRYFLPNSDEWHKAAYYDPVAERYWAYPTGSDEAPDGVDFPGDPDFDAVFSDGAANPGPNDFRNVGRPSAFGTFGQGGNVHELLETSIFGVNDTANAQRRDAGGTWVSQVNVLNHLHLGIGTLPTVESDKVGFRVASVPEPTSAAMAIAGVMGWIAMCRSRPERWRTSGIPVADAFMWRCDAPAPAPAQSGFARPVPAAHQFRERMQIRDVWTLAITKVPAH